ncbi:MAG: thiamine pyrophosphate-dependent dehydrogenase E1 component subunit alpha [bacterium]|nr:thiamine pyrophosphate-dependent dehydrogenase E1 component subunit alpha [bacterium]
MNLTDQTTLHGDPVARRKVLRADPLARYERMVEIRAAEAAIRRLHEAGHAWGSTHLADGQEAVAVGIAAALEPDELFVIGHRAHGHALAAGLTLDAVLGENCSRVIGAVGGIGGSFHLTDMAVGLVHCFTLMGAQIPIAAGLALASQVRGDGKAALAVFGDGSANIGAFHEGINLSAVWNLPVVFVCENNHWSEFTRYDNNQLIADLARRGDAYGIPWAVVDGQDVEAVAASVGEALDRARIGGGPTLLEVKTFRYGGHNRTDAATYRDPADLDAWLARDPIAAYGAHLISIDLVTTEELGGIAAAVEVRIDESVKRVLASPEPSVSAMFANVLA